MLILFHQNNTVVEVVDEVSNTVLSWSEINPTKALFLLAEKYSNRIIVWSHFQNKNKLNYKAIKAAFTANNVMVSKGAITYLSDAIGYVENSLFVNVNRKVKFPTWLMNSNCGAIYGETLLQFNKHINYKNALSYNLNSIAKLGMSKGLHCYYAPTIIESDFKDETVELATTSELFQFVKAHFKARWTVLLFFNLLLFESKIALLPFIKSLFVKQKTFQNTIVLEKRPNTNVNNTSLSVLIPTLGRAKYLHDVLKDLSLQTVKPTEVVIIEQDDSADIKSELDYLKSEAWPFKIIHKLIAQTGACNARNIGLNLVTGTYVFLADDDIRFDENTIHNTLNYMQTYAQDAVTLSCLRAGETEKHKTPVQWESFGSGCSIVKANVIKDLKFDMAFEHGFGEDTDFGMQLRNKGVDVIYVPFVLLKHLKAPIGGFRKKHEFIWNKDTLKPKPSPTIMLYKTRYQTVQQLKSYKFTLLYKFYKSQSLKNPFTYYKQFKKCWKLSENWAQTLNNIKF